MTCFSVLYGMGVLGHAIAIYLSAGILRWQLQNYAAVWLAMSIGMACVMLLVLVCVPETLPSAQAKSRPQKLTLPRLMTSTAVQMRYLVSNRFLQIWLTAVLFKSLAAGLGSWLFSLVQFFVLFSPEYQALHQCVYIKVTVRVQVNPGNRQLYN